MNIKNTTEPLSPELQALEEKIVNFIHSKCVNIYGETIINCDQLWKDYQSEVYEPGCASCARKKAAEKYSRLVDTYSRHSNINYKP
jgi:hypothetical protein